jgi:hypothetical protein
MSIRWDYISELRPQTGLFQSPTWYLRMENHGGMILTRWNRRNLRQIYSSVTFSNKNSTCINPGTNASLRGERPAIIRLSHDTTNKLKWFCILILDSVDAKGCTVYLRSVQISPAFILWSLIFLSPDHSLPFPRMRPQRAVAKEPICSLRSCHCWGRMNSRYSLLQR